MRLVEDVGDIFLRTAPSLASIWQHGLITTVALILLTLLFVSNGLLHIAHGHCHCVSKCFHWWRNMNCSGYGVWLRRMDLPVHDIGQSAMPLVTNEGSKKWIQCGLRWVRASATEWSIIVILFFDNRHPSYVRAPINQPGRWLCVIGRQTWLSTNAGCSIDHGLQSTAPKAFLCAQWISVAQQSFVWKVIWPGCQR